MQQPSCFRSAAHEGLLLCVLKAIAVYFQGCCYVFSGVLLCAVLLCNSPHASGPLRSRSYHCVFSGLLLCIFRAVAVYYQGCCWVFSGLLLCGVLLCSGPHDSGPLP